MNSSTTSDPIILNAARWFWWIAGLSLVNTVLFYSGSNTSFIVGLGLTTVAAVSFEHNVAVAIAYPFQHPVEVFQVIERVFKYFAHRKLPDFWK